MAPTLSKYDEKPEVGDLIEIFRDSFQHWGVYVGDGFIVHLTVLSEGGTTEKGIVTKKKLWDVVGSDRWEINNILDKKYHPRSADVIVREAYKKVGRERPYNVLTRNCEHFATALRYGKAESRQANKAGGKLMVTGWVGVGVAAVGAVTGTLAVYAVGAAVGTVAGVTMVAVGAGASSGAGSGSSRGASSGASSRASSGSSSGASSRASRGFSIGASRGNSSGASGRSWTR